MKTDLCSCLGHLQNDCEAMADSLLVLVPHAQTHRASSILKQIGILSPDGSKARAVENVMKQEAELKLPEEFLHSHTHTHTHTHTPPPPPPAAPRGFLVKPLAEHVLLQRATFAHLTFRCASLLRVVFQP